MNVFSGIIEFLVFVILITPSAVNEETSSVTVESLSSLFVPTPLEGEGTIYSNGFFVQSFSADRYIHRRELRLVSLESLSSAECGTKKIF